MLPVVDKPVIQYVVEEAVASGIDDIIIVTGRCKRAIEDHFDHSFELEHHLLKKGKQDEFDQVRAISDLARIHYARQAEPLGLGHAVLCASCKSSQETTELRPRTPAFTPPERSEAELRMVRDGGAYSRIRRSSRQDDVTFALPCPAEAELSAQGGGTAPDSERRPLRVNRSHDVPECQRLTRVLEQAQRAVGLVP